jgi:hypothetical protein
LSLSPRRPSPASLAARRRRSLATDVPYGVGAVHIVRRRRQVDGQRRPRAQARWQHTTPTSGGQKSFWRLGPLAKAIKLPKPSHVTI